jgi:saccharopine dehydrogenase (NAD+, L-lysine-forming)
MKKILIGIRREDINPWEKRVPLIPSHIRELSREHPLEFWLQPSERRVFPDRDYEREGARIEEHLSACPFLFAIKEIPLEVFEAGKVYVFFSHTIKGQSHNMPMLKRMAELGCTLIDYERMVDDRGRRVLFFGRQAGYAGMIDTLWTYGLALTQDGLDTPFARMRQTIRYLNLVEAREAVQTVGREIRERGLDPRLVPFVCGFAGYGHVSQGAQEIFDLLPGEEIAPGELAAFRQSGNFSAHRVYKVVFKEEDMVRPKDPAARFDLQDYYKHPENYRPVFEDVLPHLNVLINGIYWAPQYPRFVTRDALKRLYAPGAEPRLRAVGDISCDVDGSLACTVKATDPDHPIYVYDPFQGRALDGAAGRGPVVMAVYNLPAEIPLDSSIFFSQALKPWVPAIAAADYTSDFASCNLPDVIRRAVILYRGKLTPDYAYLQRHLGS